MTSPPWEPLPVEWSCLREGDWTANQLPTRLEWDGYGWAATSSVLDLPPGPVWFRLVTRGLTAELDLKLASAETDVTAAIGYLRPKGDAHIWDGRIPADWPSPRLLLQGRGEDGAAMLTSVDYLPCSDRDLSTPQWRHFWMQMTRMEA